MNISKEALGSLGVVILFVVMWNLIFLFDLLSNGNSGELINTIILDALVFYFVTESGYEKLKTFLKIGAKALFYLLIFGIAGFLVVRFFSLPPTTILIILLLSISFRRG